MAIDDKSKQPADGGSPSPLAAVGAAAPSQSRMAWEEWASKTGVPHWKADAARHGRGWPLGKEVTESEFNQAVYDAFNSRIG